jgi:hypothetical protein
MRTFPYFICTEIAVNQITYFMSYFINCKAMSNLDRAKVFGQIHFSYCKGTSDDFWINISGG